MNSNEKATTESKKKFFGSYFPNIEKDAILTLFILLCILVIIIVGVFFLLKSIYVMSVNIKMEMATWNVVIIAAIVAGLFSFLHAIFVKLLEGISCKRELRRSKQIETFEEIISFIFKYQKREGYTSIATSNEAQQACFIVNQKVMLWAPVKIQRLWIKYLNESWNRDNISYQMNAISLFSEIANQLGQKLKRDSFYDHTPLRLFYDKPDFSLHYPDRYE
ncbi:MAG: hypothetical protein ACOX9E_01525 [Lentisphaeria bacterium]